MPFPLATVQQRLAAVDQIIERALPSASSATIAAIASYLLKSGGKRLRPLLALHCAEALGGIDDGQLRYAAIIELIHAATLLHDDIVDDSELRRGKLTANKNWSNARSVLSGDYLYAQALQMAVELGSLQLLEILTTTVRNIARGEVDQLEAKTQALDQEAYLAIIARKTAILFAGACSGAAVRAGAASSVIRAAYDFGHNFGMAFQIVDDVLDYRSLADQMGKNPGQDYREGKYTLPLIIALQQSSDKSLLAEFGDPSASADTLQRVGAAMEANACFDLCLQQAQGYLAQAHEHLQALPDGAPRQALEDLLRTTASRSH